MIGTALYSLISRLSRLKMNKQFDRSMRGDLEYTIAVATYQVRLSQIMRWNILPVGALIVIGLWSSNKPVWGIGLMLITFVLAHYASGWEHTIYKSRKRDLEILQTKLNSEVHPAEHTS